MKRFICLTLGGIFALANPTFLYAHTEGVTSVHELREQDSPKAVLDIHKDPTGGFNVRVKSTKFVWRPEMASTQHVPGEGHAHVYLDGRKIMRIYNEWFHLNTFQFATRSGEQLLSIEFVGNDHAPYTVQGLPIGTEQIVDVSVDEIQPDHDGSNLPVFVLVFLVVTASGAVFFKGKLAK